ncbi:MAG TPA: SxtJ family membrane protein [Burkholderiales bacterium]|nr:SxtJ family membrane protein [Burkholderiales bacterium]
MTSFHEDLRREQEIEGSSNRSFGWVFTVFFLIVALYPLVRSEGPRVWALLAGAAFAAVTLVRPRLLAAPNRLWTRFGLLLGRIVSPVVIGILYYLVITPFGVVMRLAGKDPLRLKREPEARSYWIERDPPGPPPESMSNQF